MNRILYFSFFFVLLLQSCASKKDILYFQDATNYASAPIVYGNTTLQPNDILNITVSALVPETAIPYNIPGAENSAGATIETIKLQAYLVTADETIEFPVLGTISVKNKTISQLEQYIKKLLEEGGHLVKPRVLARLLNAKVTVLGEVNKPGTYSYTEQNISLTQALGYAGDLTINGKRKDVLLIRESNGVRTISHIDLTTANWMNDPNFVIKQNDVIIVNPNDSKVKTAGFIGNVSVILTIASLLLSTVIILIR